MSAKPQRAATCSGVSPAWLAFRHSVASVIVSTAAGAASSDMLAMLAWRGTDGAADGAPGGRSRDRATDSPPLPNRPADAPAGGGVAACRSVCAAISCP